MEKLTNEGIAEQLTSLDGWEYSEDAIYKHFVFADFKETLAIMMGIGMMAEGMNHHPEWTNVYNKLSIKLTTHDEGGVTMKDIGLAKKIEEIIKQ